MSARISLDTLHNMKRATCAGGASLSIAILLQNRQTCTFFAGAVVADGFFDAAFGVDELCFALRQQAGDLFQHGVQELVFGNGLDDFAFAKDDAATLAAGEANIGVARFAGAVDDAAHDGNVNGRLHLRETALNLVSYLDDIDLDATTGGAGDEGDAAIAQFERAQDFVGHRNLFLRLRAQADADGVADAFGQQQAEADGGFDRAGN